MGAVATTAPRQGVTRERCSPARRQPMRAPERGRATLDDRITALWDQLIDVGTGECPVCGSGIAAGVACASCGSQLT
jgi:ribosomal protein L32